MNAYEKLLGQPLNLSNCAREPIHLIGAIQPHGVLMVLAEPGLTIAQVSSNVAEHFGWSPGSLLNQPLERLFGETEVAWLRAELAAKNYDAPPQYLPPLVINGTRFERLLHRWQGCLILECEPQPAEALSALELFPALKTVLAHLQRTRTLREFCQLAADELRRFTGFDRVMIYKFLDDGAGEVVAESVDDAYRTYLGLRYPASDIPSQARTLYVKSWLRMQVDVQAAPATLIPFRNPSTQAPLDLTYAATRAMSAVHVQYLKNMGATASFSISILQNDKDNPAERLWGLVACHHHHGPRYIPHDTRMVSEFLAHFLSLQVRAKEEAEQFDCVRRLKAGHEHFIEQLGQTDHYFRGLVSLREDLQEWLAADGIALCTGNLIETSGHTPTTEQIQALVSWLQTQRQTELFHTAQLSQHYLAAREFQAVGSGLVSLRLAQSHPEYILWFRQAQKQVINWAGNPQKPVEATPDGEVLTPRKSFALWQETVEDRSTSWQACELEAVGGLWRTVLEVIVRKTEALQQLNNELTRSNLELDAFAYIASHDLKEPLRGIHNYAHFLLEDYATQLDEAGGDKLRTLVKLSGRMEALIDSLLYYSRVGRTELALQKVSFDEILDDTLELLQARFAQASIVVRRPAAFPFVLGDRTRLGEALQNLLINACKYNDKPEPWIEIGWLPAVAAASETPAGVTVFVRDNGIGIPARHHTNIFRIFKRLHGRDEYGGGNGIGLTITRKIIERHGGSLWLESAEGQGSTFFFTLQAVST